jgi:hypothetical protein
MCFVGHATRPGEQHRSAGLWRVGRVRMPLRTRLRSGRALWCKPMQVCASWCLCIAGFHRRWAAIIRRGRGSMCVFIPVHAAITTFVTRTIVTCELLAGFCHRCPDVCPLDSTVWRSAQVRAALRAFVRTGTTGWQECKRPCPVRLLINHKFLRLCAEGSDYLC